ncbi:MAG: hypothetical protein V2J65_32580, partial [Desulfobacteraceae bacterium]|nr:hypothetical protein [Desulfobacteraceae bacterium]
MIKEIERLTILLDNAQKQKIYPCILDLLTSGIVPARFKSGEFFPTRQDVTHFILAWLKHIGVPADGCRNWIIGYCERELSQISSSSPSRIRHSTKSLIKYIYRSEDVSFNCGCEQNKLRAACELSCPIYGEMKRKHKIRMKQLYDDIHYVRPKIQPIAEPPLRIKERHNEQFDKAMEVVREHLNQVSSLDEMTQYLNDQGYRTRTGKSWTIATLYREVKKHNIRFTRKKNEKVKAYEALKDQYRAQYQDGVKLMAKLYKEDVQISEIFNALEAQGYKTITGRKWTEANI